MEIKFNEKDHTYTVNGEYVNVSITQLLRKHHLAPDYKGVSEETLARAAERGTNIHKDLECLIKYPDYDPFTIEGDAFKRYIEDFIDCATAEQMLALNYKGMWIAGTADVIGFFKNKEKGCFVADHKTTSAINRDYVSWQVSIIDYMLRHLHEKINGKTFNWKGADELMCFHYAKDGTMEVIKLNRIGDEEIERLFEAEYKGEIYERRELAIDDEIKGNMLNVARSIEEAEKTLKKLKEQQKAYLDIIKKAMEEQGIKKVENDYFSVTYVYPYEKADVDKTKLKRDYPQVYTNCIKQTQVRAQVKLTLKGEENE